MAELTISSHIYDAIEQDIKDKKTCSIFQGGSRSGKTYNILLWIIFVYCMRNKNKIVHIYRAQLKNCKDTVMHDFFQIIQGCGIYKAKDHKKGDCIYNLFDNQVKFCGADDTEKLKSASRDLLFFCEVTSTNYLTWAMLAIRTKGHKIVDFNPSIGDEHWIVTKLQADPTTSTHISTYLDNYQNLPISQIEELEKLKANSTLWKIYGQGMRAIAEGLVFSNCYHIDILPQDYDFRCFGLDYGETHDPTTLVEVRAKDDCIYFKEHFYKTRMEVNEIIKLCQHYAKDNYIFADHALFINTELVKAGLRVMKARKPKIQERIKLMQTKKIYITDDSENAWKEQRNYCYPEDSNGQLQQNPIDAYNHFWDAGSYAYISWLNMSGKLSF